MTLDVKLGPASAAVYVFMELLRSGLLEVVDDEPLIDCVRPGR
jgi:hypothetical protein